jgi:hypothetical protein
MQHLDDTPERRGLKSLGSGNGLAPLFWFDPFLCVAALCEQTLDLLVNA